MLKKTRQTPGLQKQVTCRVFPRTGQLILGSNYLSRKVFKLDLPSKGTQVHDDFIAE